MPSTSNQTFDFQQDFHDTSPSDLLFTIHNIGVYFYTPTSKDFDESTEYFVLNNDNGVLAFLGLHWNITADGKLYNVKTRMMIVTGDQELLGYVQDEIVQRLVEDKIFENKIKKIIREGKSAESQ